MRRPKQGLKICLEMDPQIEVRYRKTTVYHSHLILGLILACKTLPFVVMVVAAALSLEECVLPRRVSLKAFELVHS